MSSSEPSSQPRTARRGRRSPAAAALLAAALALAGCGFQPLYGESPTGPVDETFADIQIGVIPDRSGQILRNFLIQRLNPGGRPADPAYFLSVNLRELQQRLAITQEAVAERANLLVTANYWLRDVESDEVVFQGGQTVITSFSILRDEVATLSAEQDARQRALRELSDTIRLRLALFLQNPEGYREAREAAEEAEEAEEAEDAEEQAGDEAAPADEGDGDAADEDAGAPAADPDDPLRDRFVPAPDLELEPLFEAE
jgi:LPS-assembly lipoprotein